MNCYYLELFYLESNEILISANHVEMAASNSVLSMN